MKKAILSIAMFAAFSGAAVAAPMNAGPVNVPSFGNFLANVEQSGNLSQVYFFNLLANAGSLSASYNSDPTVGNMTSGAGPSHTNLMVLDSQASFPESLLLMAALDASNNFPDAHILSLDVQTQSTPNLVTQPVE
jgi:hypothetical protein